MKKRLDNYLVHKGLVTTRSQAESYIRLGKVKVDKNIIKKPGYKIDGQKVVLGDITQYVSRAALKLESISDKFNLNFKDKVVLDVGSSTGGFTDFALRRGAKKVIAVDVGSDQLHPKLRQDKRVELHEKTDIRDVGIRGLKLGAAAIKANKVFLSQFPDIVVIDVSFISIREILPSISYLLSPNSQIIAMVKPQFETNNTAHKNKGVIKNESIRRQILADFEYWVKEKYLLADKADSQVSGEKGNKERFYKLTLLKS